jgi:hypothetical protein
MKELRMSTPKDITDFSVNTDVEAEANIESQYWVTMREALERLESNKDFQKVVLDGYFKDFAINQTSLLAMDYIRREGTRSEVMERLVAISNLQDFFMTISQLGTTTTEDDEVEE